MRTAVQVLGAMLLADAVVLALLLGLVGLQYRGLRRQSASGGCSLPSAAGQFAFIAGIFGVACVLLMASLLMLLEMF